MLINFQGIFDHKERFEMFKNNRTEMLWLSPRVNCYVPDDSKSGVPFKVVIYVVEYLKIN